MLAECASRVAKFVFVKGSHRPRPLTHLCRSLIDNITPTTRSRQSLVDKRRFGAIPLTRMRQIGSVRSGYPIEGAAALGFRYAFFAVHRA